MEEADSCLEAGKGPYILGRCGWKLRKKKLDDQGILHAVRSKRDLDEAAGAYRDIRQVMANQADLST